MQATNSLALYGGLVPSGAHASPQGTAQKSSLEDPPASDPVDTWIPNEVTGGSRTGSAKDQAQPLVYTRACWSRPEAEPTKTEDTTTRRRVLHYVQVPDPNNPARTIRQLKMVSLQESGPVQGPVKPDTATAPPDRLEIEQVFGTEPTGEPPVKDQHGNDRYLKESRTIRYQQGRPAMTIVERRENGRWTCRVSVDPEARKNGLLDPPLNGFEHYEAPSPEIERTELAELGRRTLEQELKDDDQRSFLPFLRERYGQRQNLDILELGPYCTVTVPRALVGEGRGNRYAGVDVSKAGLATQKRFLDEMDPRLSKDCSQVVASMFKLPQGDASQDLMVARASLPVFGPFDDLRAAFAESARVLRKGGEFVVDSCPFELMPPAVVQDILDHFDIVESERMGTDRMLVLRRK